MKSRFARARGTGSAHHGASHWWAQRLTAIGLVPLLLWLVTSMAALAGMEYQTAIAWVQQPLVSTLLILTLVLLFHHAQLGLQVVIEDYIHAPTAKYTMLILLKLTSLSLAVTAILAVLRISLGAPLEI